MTKIEELQLLNAVMEADNQRTALAGQTPMGQPSTDVIDWVRKSTEEQCEAELQEARKAVETQRKVAAAYLEALQDEYRPHVQQNKAFGLVIDAQAGEIAQLKAAIERVRALADAAEQAPLQRLTFMFNGKPFPASVSTDDLREALDGARD